MAQNWIDNRTFRTKAVIGPIDLEEPLTDNKFDVENEENESFY